MLTPARRRTGGGGRRRRASNGSCAHVGSRPGARGGVAGRVPREGLAGMSDRAFTFWALHRAAPGAVLDARHGGVDARAGARVVASRSDDRRERTARTAVRVDRDGRSRGSAVLHVGQAGTRGAALRTGMAKNKFVKLSDEELLERWRSRIETAKHDFHEVADGQHRFEQLVEVVNGNKRLEEIGGPFLNWIYGSHAHASVVAIRRHGDGDTNDLSLDTVLRRDEVGEGDDEMAARPEALTRSAFCKSWGLNTPHDKEMADLDFDRVPVGQTRDRPRVGLRRSVFDTRGYRSTRGRVAPNYQLGNANVTHRTERTVASVTIGDLHAAIKEQQTILQKCYGLLTHRSITGFTPVDQFDALECLTFPWLGGQNRAEDKA